MADVLEAFGGQRDRLSLSDISRRAHLPLTTAHRIVGELTARRLLERHCDGRYQIGLRLWELASSAPRSAGLRETALPFMEDLYEVTHDNVQLAVIDGNEAVYVERISGRDSVHVLTRPGGRLPVHATGVGLVLLSHAPPEVREAALRQPLARYTRYTITDPRQLSQRLDEVRTAGYAISVRQIELVSGSIAAPIKDATGAVVAALSIVVRAGARSPDLYVPAVMAAARGVSRVLSGWPG